MKKATFFLLAVFLFNCGFAQKKASFSTGDYVIALKHATDVMVTDVTSPVAAARYYAYINLSANEAASFFNEKQPRFAMLLKGLNAPAVDAGRVKEIDPAFTTVLTVYKAARRLLPSGYLLQKNIDSLAVVAARRNLSQASIEASTELADKILEQVLKFAATDGFVRLSGLKRFTPRIGDGYWQPTAPGFMAAVEPYWGTLRPFLLDSGTQFTCPPPNKYNTDTASAFYKQMKEVYETGKNLSKEQIAIASFWDCNPFALQQVGHLEFGIKKISPGGHWMGITGIACKKQNLSLSRTAYVHALVSMTLADAFISCWNEKYKHNRVRPETAIKRLIDRSWNPLLQTPPFPEYTSGHSVISTAAATVLTHLFGDRFSFVDHTEEEFGLPPRKFNSFLDAAKEAAISRLYGGIHFRDAIENGAMEGEQIGKFVIARSAEMLAGSGNSSRSVATSVENKKHVNQRMQ